MIQGAKGQSVKKENATKQEQKTDTGIQGILQAEADYNSNDLGNKSKSNKFTYLFFII